MVANEKLWSCTPSGSRLLPADLRVWAAWLDLPDEALNIYWPTLSPEEQARASRFVRAEGRARFVAARGMLRAILSACLDTEPHRIEFSYSATGKPSLGGDLAGSGLQFNLAHSGGLGVFAVTRNGIVGVDVEQVSRVPDFLGLSERFFSAREAAEVRTRSGEDRARAFYRIWTRKEAWLKATGQGIAELSRSVDVLGAPDEEGVCVGPQGGPPGTRLCLLDLAPAPGFLGALAVMYPAHETGH